MTRDKEPGSGAALAWAWGAGAFMLSQGHPGQSRGHWVSVILDQSPRTGGARGSYRAKLGPSRIRAQRCCERLAKPGATQPKGQKLAEASMSQRSGARASKGTTG